MRIGNFLLTKEEAQGQMRININGEKEPVHLCCVHIFDRREDKWIKLAAFADTKQFTGEALAKMFIKAYTNKKHEVV